MKREIDWTKIFLLIVVLAGGVFAVKDKIQLPTLNVDTNASLVPIPVADTEATNATRSLATARNTNTAAAAVVSDFLAALAWVIENDDNTRNGYNSSNLMLAVERGLESLVALQREVGDIDIGDALNSSLQTIWGDQTRELTIVEAARGLYACAAALQIQSGGVANH